MKILISPYSKLMRNGKENPKNYPYWEEVVKLLRDKGHEVVQIVYSSEKQINGCTSYIQYGKLRVVELLLDQCDTFIGVDNFLQHLAHYKKKYGVVLWGRSDPNIFGYSEHVNLLKDRKHLRNHQFETWEAEQFDASVFVDAQKVVEAVEKFNVSKS